jgi:hypothetical protein
VLGPAAGHECLGQPRPGSAQAVEPGTAGQLPATVTTADGTAAVARACDRDSPLIQLGKVRLTAPHNDGLPT